MPDRDMQALGEMFGLEGSVAVVTGASSGIGAAIAQGLVMAGAKVFGMSRRAQGPAGVISIGCDLEVPEAVPAAIAKIEREARQISILVNAAGISIPLDGTESDFGAELGRFRRTIEVDLVAAYACTMAVRPLMRRAGRGAVINVTSVNSVRGFPGNPGYVAAKAGLAGLTRALAVDLAVDNIRVNALAPGYVHTAMTAASHQEPALHEQRRRHTIVGRWGVPQEMVGAAIFLASAASAYVTGQEIFVDGGWTARGLLAFDN
jgi:NAD(P)-dependent dehydrogenase (short-subunit alcohol dehydrogenase family)